MDRVVCEYCHQPFCRADYNTMTLPMTAEQFKPIMPEVRPPFVDGFEWIQWRCPFCGCRPFYTDHSLTVMNDRGFTRVVDLKKIIQDRHLAERNQVEIDAAFEEEAEETTFLDRIFKKKHRCECGAEYQHQSSLARHKKTCQKAKK